MPNFKIKYKFYSCIIFCLIKAHAKYKKGLNKFWNKQNIVWNIFYVENILKDIKPRSSLLDPVMITCWCRMAGWF